MSWPAWIEELKIRYLADESNVFLLHGDAVLSGRWAVPGEIVDCADLVRRFLEPSRDIVGVFDPDPSDGKAPPDVRRSAMDFRGVEDIGQFRRLVEVRFTLDGVRARKRMDTPEGALGLVWIALTTRGKDQGYIVKKTDKVLNSRRKNPPPFDHGAPPLVEWPGHAGFEGTNNVVVLLAADLSTVRSDLVEACAKIEVTPHHAQLAEAEFAPVGDEQAAATAEIEDALSLKRAPKPPPMEEAEAELDRALAGEDELSMRREEEDPPAAEPVTEPLPDIVDLLPTEPLPEVALPPPTTAEEIDLPERVDQALRRGTGPRTCRVARRSRWWFTRSHQSAAVCSRWRSWTSRSWPLERAPSGFRTGTRRTSPSTPPAAWRSARSRSRRGASRPRTCRSWSVRRSTLWRGGSASCWGRLRQ